MDNLKFSVPDWCFMRDAAQAEYYTGLKNLGFDCTDRDKIRKKGLKTVITPLNSW